MENTICPLRNKIIKLLICMVVIGISIGVIIGVCTLFYYYPVGSTCKVEFIKGEDDSITQVYYKGDEISFPETPIKEGYEFLGWSLTESSLDIVDDLEVVANGQLKFYATWREKTYRLQYLQDDYSVKYNSLIQVKQNSLNFNDANGSEINLFAQKLGYNLLGFKDTDGIVYNEDFYVVDDIAVAPLWDIKQYKVKFVNNGQQYNVKVGNTTITSENIDINFGHDLEFKINLSKPYAFSNIRVSAVSDNIRLELKPTNGVYRISDITSNFTITVENIQFNKYQVYVDDKYYGDFSYGSMLTLDSDNKIIIRDFSDSHNLNIYTLFDDNDFEGWYLYNDQLLSNSSIQDIAIGNKISIKGKYSKDIYRIKLESNGGDISQEELIFIEGSEIILPTPTRNGYKFAGWFVDLVEKNTTVLESESVRFETVDSDYMVLYAGWVRE